MSSVEQRTPADANGGQAAATIPVENPATGQLITTIPVLGPEELEAMAARARQAQPGWAAAGFEERGRVLRRAQKWMLDHADRILDVVVSESGKTYEDAQLADLAYTVSALGFWAKEAAEYLADERVPSWNNPIVIGKKLADSLRADRRRGGDRPLELPDRELVRGLHPGPRRRQQRDPQAERGDAAELAVDGRDDAGMRAPGGCVPGRHRRRFDRSRADRAGRLRDVHRLDADREGGHEGRRRRADSRATWNSAARIRCSYAPTPISTGRPTPRPITR